MQPIKVRAAGETIVAPTPEELRAFVDRLAKQAIAEMKQSADLATASRKTAGQNINAAGVVKTLEEPVPKWVATFKELVAVLGAQVDAEFAETRARFAELEAIHAQQTADLAAIKAVQSRRGLPAQKSVSFRDRTRKPLVWSNAA